MSKNSILTRDKDKMTQKQEIQEQEKLIGFLVTPKDRQLIVKATKETRTSISSFIRLAIFEDIRRRGITLDDNDNTTNSNEVKEGEN